MVGLPPLLIDIPRNPVLAVGLPLALSFGTGVLTKKGDYSADSVWYKSLKKPKYDPPRWAFGIWPFFYASMGWASHLTVRSLDRTPPGAGRDNAKLALTLYYAQLALNQAWTPLCFSAGSLGGALVDITALTGTVWYWFGVLKDGVSDDASYFVLPYAAWSTYATYLNASLWWNNGGRESVKKLIGKAEDAAEDAKKKAEELGRDAKQFGKDASRKAEQLGRDASNKAEQLGRDASNKADQLGRDASKKADEVEGQARRKADELK